MNGSEKSILLAAYLLQPPIVTCVLFLIDAFINSYSNFGSCELLFHFPETPNIHFYTQFNFVMYLLLKDKEKKPLLGWIG